MGDVFWLTGNSGAGKTTLARAVQANLPCIVLDGDAMRASISLGEGFSREDRERHNLRVARLAAVLASQGFRVIVAVIAPFEATRRKVDSLCRPYWVYVKRTQAPDAEKPYEPPENPQLVLDNDALSPTQSRDRLLQFIRDARFEEPWTPGCNPLQSCNA